MAPPRKTVDDFEAEATLVGECLVHPSKYAPRKVYKLRHGSLPSHLFICHTCDVTGCISEHHHFVGTAKDNTIDSVLKGRHSCFRKGGTRFTGHHTDEAKAKISAASKRMWEKRRENA